MTTNEMNTQNTTDNKTEACDVAEDAIKELHLTQENLQDNHDTDNESGDESGNETDTEECDDDESSDSAPVNSSPSKSLFGYIGEALTLLVRSEVTIRIPSVLIMFIVYIAYARVLRLM